MTSSALLAAARSLNLLVAQTASPSRPFWQDLLLQAIGPLVAAVVGSLAVGLILNSWTSRKADRSAARDLRLLLIEDLLTVANELRVASDILYQAKAMNQNEEHLAPLLRDAREAYGRCTVKMPVIETKLELYFPESRASILWHSVIDCLAVVYYMSIEAPPAVMEYFYEKLAKDVKGEHSGLTGEQIRNRSRLLKHARFALLEATRLINSSPISPPIGNELARR